MQQSVLYSNAFSVKVFRPLTTALLTKTKYKNNLTCVICLQGKSYVMIHVIKHDMDPYSNINYLSHRNSSIDYWW